MSLERSRKLVAIMFTDIVGYSRMMSNDEDQALRLLDTHDAILSRSIEKFGGTILKRMGDAVFAKFESATDAVRCGIDIQQQIGLHNQDCGPSEQLCIRIGIHLGDVIVRGNDLFGEGINVAARLEPLAQPGGICISQAVFQAIKSSGGIEPLLVGEVELKNILERLVIYQFPPFYAVDAVRQESNPPAGSRSKSSRIKLVRAEKLPPANSGLQVVLFTLVLGVVVAVVGGVVGWNFSPRSNTSPFELHGSEIRDARHIAASLSQSKSGRVEEIWRLVSVEGKYELRALQNAAPSESSDGQQKRVLLRELNGIIGGTQRLTPSGSTSDGMTADINRRTLEALFPDDISVLLRPRDFPTWMTERVRGLPERVRADVSILWKLAVLIMLGVASLIGFYVTVRPAVTRYIFDDIRDVDEMMEYLIGELGFKPPVWQGKSLVFRATITNYLLWGTTKFTARIDGSTVVVSGPAIFVKRLTKSLFALMSESSAAKAAA